MKLQTPVEIAPLGEKFGYESSITFIGSCFAQEMGRRMKDLFFDVMVNPFGVLFNPLSVADCLGLMEGYGINPYGCRFVESDVIKAPQGYVSFHHHGSFSRPTVQEFLQNANSELSRASAHYGKQGWVVVTLGTAFVYEHKESGMAVSNCHKLPSSELERRMLSVREVTNCLKQYVNANPERQWIFTVSPVRHLNDGLHQNTLSKSVLHLAIEQLTGMFPNAHYFPAYEILLDELRDYRFFDDDMMHPSHLAADHIFQRFLDFAFDPDFACLLEEAAGVRRMLRHNTLNPGTHEAKKFEEKRQKALTSLMEKIKAAGRK